MMPVPADPLAFRARVFGALCDDILDMDSGRSHKFGRTDALREIVRLGRCRRDAHLTQANS